MKLKKKTICKKCHCFQFFLAYKVEMHGLNGAFQWRIKKMSVPQFFSGRFGELKLRWVCCRSNVMWSLVDICTSTRSLQGMSGRKSENNKLEVGS